MSVAVTIHLVETVPHQGHHMNTPHGNALNYIQEKLNMFTMEISVHSDKHSIAIYGICSMVCVRGQQRCSLLPIGYPGRIRGKPGSLSCSTITKRPQ